MKNIFFKKHLSLFFLSVALFIIPLFHSNAQLNSNAQKAIHDQSKSMAGNANFDTDIGQNTLSSTIASLIKTFLGLLGIIFIVLVIWAGYNWMTAGGNEDKVSKAKTTLTRAIIGLVITVSAYAITYFIFGAIDKAT